MKHLKWFFALIAIIFIVLSFSNLRLKHEKRIILNSTSVNSTPPIVNFYPHIAVLVEFRAVDHIVTIVHNVNHHIPSTWPIQIFHGKDNEQFIRNSTLAPLIALGKILLTLMTEIYNRSRTNELLTDRKFWQRVLGEKILLFQIDSAMCSNSPHKITDFLQYDYVGAPWDPAWFTFSKSDLVGNGGFSLRTRSKILALLAIAEYNRHQPEDVWYSQNLRRVNASIAPVDVAKTFAVESVYYERPLGVHRYPIKCDMRRKLFVTCPESMMIMPETCA